MHAVVFQFRPHPDQHGTYFAHVARLRPELQRIDGFLDNERFASAAEPGWLLSLSLWRDEAAILRWRQHAGHRVAQECGKREVFAAYRLRVGEVEEGGTAAPTEPRLRLAIGRGLATREGGELFRGITEPDRELVLGGAELAPKAPAERRLTLRVIRDYGPASPSAGTVGTLSCGRHASR
jgi:heme-degrading monooxygenase HmoA